MQVQQVFSNNLKCQHHSKAAYANKKIQNSNATEWQTFNGKGIQKNNYTFQIAYKKDIQ